MPAQNFGGWLCQLSKSFAASDTLTIMFPIEGKKENYEGSVNGLYYSSFPLIKYPSQINDALISSFASMIEKTSPDIIHIWGTEFLHSYVFFQACDRLGLLHRTVVYIQGLVSVYKNYYWCFLNDRSVMRPTMRDLLKKSGPYFEYKDFITRSKYEVLILNKAKNVLGRTDWDRYYTTSYNPGVKYHFCNETLRDTFYDGEWTIEKCVQHSIFLSQGNYPIKGLHQAIKAASLLIHKYPDIQLICTGKDRVHPTWYEKLKENSYDRYVRHLIKRCGMANNISFIGLLNAEQMKEQYLKANVFLSPSSIENSSNSIGEAMLLGTPVVSSDVGGIRNLMINEEEGLIYPADDVASLAKCIDRIFSDTDFANHLSHRAKQKAAITHNAEKNFTQLKHVYFDILEK